MNLAKQIVSTSKDLGSNVYDLASNVGSKGFDLAKIFGSNTADLAKSFGSSTADLAKQIGWKRGLIGLAAIAGATFGTIAIVRYLRARNAETPAEGEEAGAEGGNRFVPKHKKHKAFVAHH
jgi:hypothetical protein